MLRYLRNTKLEKIIKSNLLLILLSNFIIKKFNFLLPYEQDWFFFKEFLLKKNEIILDIGAHWGESAIVFRKFFPNNLIISFEPNKYTYLQLQNVTKNLNVQTFNYGIGKKGRKNIYFPYCNNRQLSLWGSSDLILLKDRIKKFTHLDEQKIEYKKSKFKFDELPKLKNKVGIIKIDVEGSEHLVLSHITSVLKKDKPLLFIEYNSNNFEKIFLKLNKFGYKAHTYFDGKLKPIKECRKFEKIAIKKRSSINIIFKKNVLK
tara:strand:- start:575 stop:1357 length:783 start_codon:yes stop_codon:yes gene_type:complete